MSDPRGRPAESAEAPTGDTEVVRLVREAQRGEEAAFAQLYDTYYNRVYRYMAYRVESAADAEDLTEDVFLRILESIKSFQPRDVPFSAWVMRIAHNRLIDHWRRGRHRSGIPLEEAPPILAEGAEPSARIESLSHRQTLQAALRQLTDLQQQVLSLRFGGDLSVAETAKAMKRTEGAVKALQHSAIAALRRIMAPGSD